MRYNVDREAAEREFAIAVSEISNRELRELESRIANGCIEGNYYINGICGCFYGTISMLRNPRLAGYDPEQSTYQESDALTEKVQYLRQQLIGDVSAFISWSDVTVLESQLIEIHPGDTPETHEASEWLHSLVVGEMKRRGLVV